LITDSSWSPFIGLLSRFLVALRVKVLEELFEVYRGYFLEALNFVKTQSTPALNPLM
jgi:hypothetical protein